MAERNHSSTSAISRSFRRGGHAVDAVKGVSFTIAKGETVALVGEFGLGQDRLGAVDPAAAALSVGVASHRRDPASGARTC